MRLHERHALTCAMLRRKTSLTRRTLFCTYHTPFNEAVSQPLNVCWTLVRRQHKFELLSFRCEPARRTVDVKTDEFLIYTLASGNKTILCIWLKCEASYINSCFCVCYSQFTTQKDLQLSTKLNTRETHLIGAERNRRQNVVLLLLLLLLRPDYTGLVSHLPQS